MATSSLEPLLIAPKDAWHLLAVGNTKGYELIAQGKLVTIKIGRSTRITMDSIRALANGEGA